MLAADFQAEVELFHLPGSELAYSFQAPAAAAILWKVELATS